MPPWFAPTLASYLWGACVPVAVIIPFPQMQGSSIRRCLRMSRKWRKTRSWQCVQLFFSLAACSPQIFSVWLVCSGFFHGVEVCINLGTIGLVTTLKLRCKVFRRVFSGKLPSTVGEAVRKKNKTSSALPMYSSYFFVKLAFLLKSLNLSPLDKQFMNTVDGSEIQLASLRLGSVYPIF